MGISTAWWWVFPQPVQIGAGMRRASGRQAEVKEALMLRTHAKLKMLALVLGMFWLIPAAAVSQNRVMGQLRFDAQGWTNQMAGVWLDGQYVGYVKELHGNRTVFLLPGKHSVQVREAGYREITDNLVISPGQVDNIGVELQRQAGIHYSATPAVVETYVNPGRAAVFVDGMYAGHADEFDGGGNELLLQPGQHKIDIALPGYKPFTTEVSLLPNQLFKFQVKLVPGSILRADANLLGKPAGSEDK
jgi:hypothetical protein